MKNIQLKAYSKLKHEDITPYVDEQTIIVCDGLGGSGSMLHVIEDSFKILDITHMADIVFLEEFKDIQIDTYEQQLLEELLSYNNYTSAYYASRIIGLNMKRYFQIKSTDDMPTLSNKLIVKLREVAKALGIEMTQKHGQILFPTTLLAYHLNDTYPDLLDVYYAGDSRGYMINKTGLVQLTKDDEDASGALSNLLYAIPTDDHKLMIHHNQYELKQPCILMGISDGGFDPFEPYGHHGLAYALYEVLLHVSDEDAFNESFKTYFDHILQDDTSIGMISIGLDSFESFKSFVLDKLKSLHDHYQLYLENRVLFSALQQDIESIHSYIKNRTMDKKGAIIKNLMDQMNALSLPFQLKSYLTDLQQHALEENIKRDQEKKLKTLLSIIDTHEFHKEPLLVEAKVDDDYDLIYAEYQSLILQHQNQANDDLSIESQYNSHNLEIEACIDKITNTVTTAHNFVKKSERVLRFHKEKIQTLKMWIKTYDKNKDKVPLDDFEGVYHEATQLIEKIESLSMKQIELSENPAKLEEQIKSWRHKLQTYLIEKGIQTVIFDVSVLNLLPKNAHYSISNTELEVLIHQAYQMDSDLFYQVMNYLLESEITPLDMHYNQNKLLQARLLNQKDNRKIKEIQTLQDTLDEEAFLIENSKG